MSQDSSSGGFRGFRDTAQVDMPMAPPRPTGPVGASHGSTAVRAESRPGQGTTMTFTLPVS